MCIIMATTCNNITSSPVNQQQGHRKLASEHRRCNKPIMEKKRRARINSCLDELKSLILDAMKKDPARHSKLEKADILEMTVKHLESLQRQQMAMTVAADPNVLNKYRAGFNECATEVGRFLGRGDAPQLDPHLKRRLLAHLTNCLNTVTANDAQSTPVERMIRVQLPTSSSGHVMQLVPTCLPSGDIAFVLPQATKVTNCVESAEKRAARTAVVAPLSVALDLSVSALDTPDVKPVVINQPPCQVKQEEEDVWRPW